MGKHRRNRRDDDDDDDSDNDKMDSHDKSKSMDDFLMALFEKRRAVREKGLSSMAEGFTNNWEHKFAEQNFETVLYQCLISMKRGSAKQIYSASRIIGLLSISLGCADNAHKVYEESLPQLSLAFVHGSKPVELSSILDSLAVITFVGATNSDETQASMQIIWKFLHPLPCSEESPQKHSESVLVAAISAWSFLLSTLDGWRLDHNYWKDAISYFTYVLEDENESIRVAAVNALSLIIEMGCLKKFSSEQKGPTVDLQELKDIILKQKKIKVTRARAAWKCIEDGNFSKTCVKVGARELTLSSCSQMIQLSFLRRFLGHGFVKHILVNEFLHDVFHLTPRTKNVSRIEQYISDKNEKVTIQYFIPEARHKECVQRLFKSPNSALNKARTRVLDKQRVLSQGRNLGHYIPGIDEET